MLAESDFYSYDFGLVGSASSSFDYLPGSDDEPWIPPTAEPTTADPTMPDAYSYDFGLVGSSSSSFDYLGASEDWVLPVDKPEKAEEVLSLEELREARAESQSEDRPPAFGPRPSGVSDERAPSRDEREEDVRPSRDEREEEEDVRPPREEPEEEEYVRPPREEEGRDEREVRAPTPGAAPTPVPVVTNPAPMPAAVGKPICVEHDWSIEEPCTAGLRAVGFGQSGPMLACKRQEGCMTRSQVKAWKQTGQIYKTQEECVAARQECRLP